MTAFYEVDKEYMILNPYECKNNACIINLLLVMGHQVFCVNLGNNRSFLIRGGEVVELSLKHEKQRKLEQERIERKCNENDINREKNVKFTRCFGYTDYKSLPENLQVDIASDYKTPFFNSIPELWFTRLKGNEHFLMLGNRDFWKAVKIKQLFPL